MPRVRRKIPRPPPKPTTTERTADVTTSSLFSDLGLSPAVLLGIHNNGFLSPSPIQLRAIPQARFGADVVVQSKAGTGKTLVFVVAILENVIVSDAAGLQAVVLAPTREIAHQIGNVLRSVGTHVNGVTNGNNDDASTGTSSSSSSSSSASSASSSSSSPVDQLQCHCFIGGLPLRDDLRLLRMTSCHVAVGTPGRVRQLVTKGALDTRRASMLVLDEADKMLGDSSQGSFSADILAIVSSFPPRRQILTFSATYPSHLSSRIASIMKDAVVMRECIDDLNEMEELTQKRKGGGRGEEEGSNDGMMTTSSSKSSATPSLLGVAQYYALLPSLDATYMHGGTSSPSRAAAAAAPAAMSISSTGMTSSTITKNKKRTRTRTHYEKFICKLDLVVS